MLGKACMLTGISHPAAVQEHQAGATDVPCVRRKCGHLMAVPGCARAQQAWPRARAPAGDMRQPKIELSSQSVVHCTSSIRNLLPHMLGCWLCAVRQRAAHHVACHMRCWPCTYAAGVAPGQSMRGCLPDMTPRGQLEPDCLQPRIAQWLLLHTDYTVKALALRR